MSNGLDIGRIPVFLQQSIIKKMKLLAAIRLQKSCSHFNNLVDETHNRILSDYRLVESTPGRLFDKLPIEENEYKSWEEKAVNRCFDIASDYYLSSEVKTEMMRDWYDVRSAVTAVRQDIYGPPHVAR